MADDNVSAQDEQRPLFDDAATKPAWVPRAPQDTSHEAADAIAPKAKTLREQVFEALVRRPMSDQQIAAELDLGLNTVRPRRRELVVTGRVRESSERVTLPSGRQAIVWEAVRDHG